MAKTKKRVSAKLMRRKIITTLNNERYSDIKSNDLLRDFHSSMTLTKEDKASFRRTQTKFDKVFYNLMTKGEEAFTITKKNLEEVVLVEFYRKENHGAFTLSLTPEGKIYSQQIIAGEV